MKNVITMCDDNHVELDNEMLIELDIFNEMGSNKYYIPDYILGESCHIEEIFCDEIKLRLVNGDWLKGTLV